MIKLCNFCEQKKEIFNKVVSENNKIKVFQLCQTCIDLTNTNVPTSAIIRKKGNCYDCKTECNGIVVEVQQLEDDNIDAILCDNCIRNKK